jgi:hypothetical protein
MISWHHQLPFANHECCFNEIFENNLFLQISFLVLFHPALSCSFVLEKQSHLCLQTMSYHSKKFNSTIGNRNYKYLWQFTNSLISVLIDKLIFIDIWSNSNIYWFICIRIWCQQIQMKSFSVTFYYLKYSVTYLMSNNEGNLKLFAVIYNTMPHLVATSTS